MATNSESNGVGNDITNDSGNNDGTINGADFIAESSNGIVEPVITSENNGGGNDPAAAASKRGRGRPAGSAKPTSGGSGSGTRNESKPGKASRKTALVLDKSLLGKQITGLHAVAALQFKNSDLMITPEEGETLAGPLADIVKEYGLSVSTKGLLFVQLIGACAAVYGPKVAKMRQAKKAANSELYPLAG